MHSISAPDELGSTVNLNLASLTELEAGIKDRSPIFFLLITRPAMTLLPPYVRVPSVEDGTAVIVTDSNSGILQSEAEKLGIYVIPMPFLIRT